MIRVLVLALLLWTAPVLAREGVKAPPGQFDYLLLNLSWSPKFCDGQKDTSDNQEQCSPGRRFGFVVHGLWPQYENGTWPEYCATGDVPRRIVDDMLDLMPSRNLVRHEWRRHGSCSGQRAEVYFGSIRSIMARIQIPERYRAPEKPVLVAPETLLADFVAANRRIGLSHEHMALRCKGRDLAELAICLSPDGKTPRRCGQLSFACRSKEIRLLELR